MLDQVKELLKTVTNDEDFFTLMAEAAKKFYDALLIAGFTEQQATTITAVQGSVIKASYSN